MLEDMLQGYALDFSGSWDKYIPFMEFLITTVISPVFVWPLMNLYMIGDVELLYVGQNLTSIRLLVLI